MIPMFERESTIIKEPRKLSFDYIPDRLPGREEQLSLLEMIFRPVIESGTSEYAFFTGSVGTGKTVTSKFFINELMRYSARHNVPIDYIFVNCRQKGTESGVLYQCLHHFDEGYPDRGFSPEEMLRALRSHIERSKKRIIIVMDEANILLKKGPVNLIYQLSRMSEESINMQLSVSLILISQEYVIDRLDEASRSTFKKVNTIRFDRYSLNQLKEIVRYRAEESLMDGSYDDNIINMIAEIASADGDARFAIDLLDKAARTAETRPEGKITPEDVRQVGSLVFSVVNTAKLEELGRNELFALLAVSRAIKDKGYIRINDAEKTYHVVCEEYGEEPRKHTQFYQYVRDLMKQNLLSEAKDAEPSKSMCVSLPDIPSKELSKRIEKILGDPQ